MRTIIVSEIKKTNTYRHFVGYIIDGDSAFLISPQQIDNPKKSAQEIGMDYFSSPALPPYGWKIGIFTHYLEQEVSNTIKLLGYTGEFNFIIVNGFHNQMKRITI